MTLCQPSSGYSPVGAGRAARCRRCSPRSLQATEHGNGLCGRLPRAWVALLTSTLSGFGRSARRLYVDSKRLSGGRIEICNQYLGAGLRRDAARWQPRFAGGYRR